MSLTTETTNEDGSTTRRVGTATGEGFDTLVVDLETYKGTQTVFLTNLSKHHDSGEVVDVASLSARQAIRLGALLVDAGLTALDGKVQG
ncbi:hypothetical protein [Gordonia sputi]